MDIIFTIVAKNYLASAITLGESVKKYSNCDFIIFLADRLAGEVDVSTMKFPVIEVEKLDLPNFKQQSFMYDIVEFSTAVKPYCMRYLMDEKAYTKVIYLDPDTWIMESMEEVFHLLEKWDFVVTPHIVDMTSMPNEKETHILDRGVFNLGFLAARNTESSKEFLYWWQKRLEIYCFRDNRLFVDQKWVEYLPVFSDSYYVLKNKAYNMADWNYHERELLLKDGKYYVQNGDRCEKLIFFHFSGVKPDKIKRFFENNSKIIRKESVTALKALITEYCQELMKNGYNVYSKMPYAYGYYSNGNEIKLLHRRIYRKYRQEILEPFLVAEGSFYSILKKEKLISNITSNPKVTNKKEYSKRKVQENVGQTVKGKLFILIMKMIIRIFGIDTYLSIVY